MSTIDEKDVLKQVIKDCKIMIEDESGFTHDELNNLAISLVADMQEAISEDIKNNGIYQALYNSANEFYNNIIKLNQTSIDSLSHFSANNIGSMTTGYEARTIRLRLAYLSAFKFAEYVHRYLKQPLSKALVVLDGNNGEPPYTVEISLIDLVKATGSAGDIHQTWVKDIIKASETKNIKDLSIEATSQIKTKHLQRLQIAYSYVQQHMRYVEQTRIKVKDGKEKKITGGQYYIKLHNNNDEWRTYNIINQGDLKEAYAAALMRQHQTKFDSICKAKKQDEVDLASAFFHNYIALVDNKGALLGEDIILKNIQYAVKAADATMPKLAQYIRAAQAILASKNNLQKGIKTYFKKEKDKQVALRNKLVETEIQAVTDALEGTFDPNT